MSSPEGKLSNFTALPKQNEQGEVGSVLRLPENQQPLPTETTNTPKRKGKVFDGMSGQTRRNPAAFIRALENAERQLHGKRLK
jgi:hypothetical protein